MQEKPERRRERQEKPETQRQNRGGKNDIRVVERKESDMRGSHYQRVKLIGGHITFSLVA